MTKRDFFILAIKLFALFALITALYRYVNYTFEFVVMSVFDGELDFPFFIIGLLIEVVPFLLLVFYADKVVNVLKLTNKFETQTIDLGGLSVTGVIKISCFIIGAYLIIESAANLLYQLFMAFKYETTTDFDSFRDVYRIDYGSIAVDSLNVIIGYIVMVNFDWVAKLLNKPKKVDEEEL